MADTKTPGRKMIGCAPTAVEWVRDELGLEPTLVYSVAITIDPALAVTARIDMFLTDEQLKALHLEDMEEVVDG